MGLSENDIFNEVVRHAVHLKPVEKIILFGSRAMGTATPTSDIDIAIIDNHWTDTDVNLLKNQLEEEVKTPLEFDIVNFHSITKPQLKENIMKGRVLYGRAD